MPALLLLLLVVVALLGRPLATSLPQRHTLTTRHNTHTRVPATLSQADVVLDETAPTLRLHDLGIEATSMEMPGFNFLHRYRSGSHFVEMSGDKDK